MKNLLKKLLLLWFVLFSSISSLAGTCQDALELFDNGFWEEALKVASSVNLRYSNINDKCEFVIAASDPKTFSRIAKLELFIKKYPHSDLLERARYEEALTLWLLGDIGGALDKLARSADIIRSYEVDLMLSFLLSSKEFKEQVLSRLNRARSYVQEPFISDLLDIYIMKSEFGFKNVKELEVKVGRLLRDGTVDENVAINLAERAHDFLNNQTSSLRFYIARNGFDDFAKARAEKLGLKEAGGVNRESPLKRCLSIELVGQRSNSVEEALLLWFKDKRVEVSNCDDGDRIIVGSFTYEEMELVKKELERLFDLVPKIVACPKKKNNYERQ